MIKFNVKILHRVLLLAAVFPDLYGQTLPVNTSELFSGSGNCAVCHTKGSPNTTVLTDEHGRDVSPATYWRSTMMANAAKDPLWQAKVQAEIHSNPHLQSVIEDKCTTCHAPMGKAEAEYNGQVDYSIDEMLADPLAMDGVSCTLCHQIEDQNLGSGESFSGGYTIGENRIIYGPFNNPVTGPMVNFSNYTPMASTHVGSSELCATCHTLFTPFVNDAGEVMGEAPEQVPYLEWLNSDYPEMGVECQSCHMPDISENIILSNRPQWLGARNPLHAHEFVGGNVFMLKMLRDFRDELDVRATTAQLDSTIARSMHLLQNKTVNMEISADWNATGDSMDIMVDVQNLAGHKFPTAYPSRRAWIELKVEDHSGNTLFHSGSWDETGDILGLDPNYEPHHQQILDQQQVQVYQNIPSDHNGSKTYTLLRIAGYLKDNRLPPQGYRSDGLAADTTRIIGLATLDPDFNLEGSVQGSGHDLVHYRVGGLDPDQNYVVSATMNYQSIAPRFIEDLFSYDVPEVNDFQTYYEQMDLSPIAIAVDSHTLLTSEIDPQSPNSPLLVQAFPNPFNPETNIQINIPTNGEVNLSIFDLQGKRINAIHWSDKVRGSHQYAWDGKDSQQHILSAGVYLVYVEFKAMGSPFVIHANSKIVFLK